MSKHTTGPWGPGRSQFGLVDRPLTQSQIKRAFYKRLYHEAVEMDAIYTIWNEIKEDGKGSISDRDLTKIRVTYNKFLDEIQKKSKP